MRAVFARAFGNSGRIIPQGKATPSRVSKARAFFTDAGFYPDFILWIKRGGGQRIVFVEPHGMLLEKHPVFNAKTRLHELLAKVSRELSAAHPEWENTRMDSFVISRTDCATLRERFGPEWTEEKFRRHHILFPREDHGHIGEILAEEE